MRGPAPLLALLLLGAPPGCRRGEAPAPAPSPARPPAPEPGPATLAAVVGAVRVRAEAGGTEAAGAPARAGAALAAGGLLETGTDGAATLRLPGGRELEIAANARVRLVGPPRDGAVQVVVEQGVVVSRTPARPGDAGGVALEVLTPFGVTRVPAGGAGARIEVALGRVRISVAVGAVTFVDGKGGRHTARAGEAIEVSVGGVAIVRAPRAEAAGGAAIAAAPAARPRDRAAGEIALPTQRGLRVFGDRVRQVTLTWPEEPGAAEVTIAADPEFAKPLRVERIEGNRLTVDAPARGPLHWRVRLPGGRALVGEARFLRDRPRADGAIAGPRNVVADTGEKATIYFQGSPPALTLAFSAAPGARRYRVQVFRAEDLKAPVVERDVGEPRCALPPGALPEGRYVWHAAPIGADGRARAAGRMNKLELVWENALNALAIARPAPGDAVEGDGVDVAGVAPLGSRLYVNGRPAPLDGRGRFELRVARAPALIFRLVGRSGAESYWVRTLRTRS